MAKSSKSEYHLCVNNTNPTEGAKGTQGLRRWQRQLGNYSRVHILIAKSLPSPPSEGPNDMSRNGQLIQKPTALPSLITKSLFFSSFLSYYSICFSSFLDAVFFSLSFSYFSYLLGLPKASMATIYDH